VGGVAAAPSSRLQTDSETECDLPGGETIGFHRRCYLLWDDALLKLPT